MLRPHDLQATNKDQIKHAPAQRRRRLLTPKRVPRVCRPRAWVFARSSAQATLDPPVVVSSAAGETRDICGPGRLSFFRVAGQHLVGRAGRGSASPRSRLRLVSRASAGASRLERVRPGACSFQAKAALSAQIAARRRR